MATMMTVGTAAQAAVIVPISNTYGFTTTRLPELTDGVGITKTDPNDPSTWINSGTDWKTEESYADPLSGATNGKLGWYAFDLGSTQSIDDIIVIAGNHSSRGSAGSVTLGSFNVYTADSPTVALSSSGDYDFASGGWTQRGGTFTVTSVGEILVLNQGVSAQFVGIEIMSDFDDGVFDDRTGMEEFAVTAIPEPSAAILAGLGLAGLTLRRRRRN